MKIIYIKSNAINTELVNYYTSLAQGKIDALDEKLMAIAAKKDFTKFRTLQAERTALVNSLTDKLKPDGKQDERLSQYRLQGNLHAVEYSSNFDVYIEAPQSTECKLISVVYFVGTNPLNDYMAYVYITADGIKTVDLVLHTPTYNIDPHGRKTLIVSAEADVQKGGEAE